MAEEPINPSLMDSYRTVLLTSSAPSFIDTSLAIQPVAMITSASLPINVSSVSTGVSVPSSLQTAINSLTTTSATSMTANTETATLKTYTVTTGKTLYVTDVMGIQQNSGGGAGILLIYDDGVIVHKQCIIGGGNNTAGGATGQVTLNTPIVIASASAVTFTVLAGVTASADIFMGIRGIEV